MENSDLVKQWINDNIFLLIEFENLWYSDRYINNCLNCVNMVIGESPVIGECKLISRVIKIPMYHWCMFWRRLCGKTV
jgi:hypothetical protein